MRTHNQVIEVIPYKSFKEKNRIINNLNCHSKVEIFGTYIFIERWEKVRFANEKK